MSWPSRFTARATRTDHGLPGWFSWHAEGGEDLVEPILDGPLLRAWIAAWQRRRFTRRQRAMLRVIVPCLRHRLVLERRIERAKLSDCTNTILPATAAANDGLCAPCVGKIRRAEWDEYVRLNRRTVDLYEGVTDPVEQICILLTSRKHDPLIVYAPAPAAAPSVRLETQVGVVAAAILRTGAGGDVQLFGV